ncbi:mammalian cell entry protein [Nocardioides silvaticus]|uniref:Mammalian cell entry protein n=1 Tax=Nocardioides silvaticus TaxID=2201891 RepID=A0A316TCC1_9ACTN|nr:MCE family protein [Nocardioides silvaticus]PWN02023.1 mammalian cell entry protein [Nocardioides silvaticus]
MRNRRLRAAAALATGALLLSGCEFDVYQLPLPGGADVGDDPIEVTVEFQDVLDLVPKSSVKVSDVTVGQVTDVDLDGYNAVVTLEMRNDTGLPDNAVATIRQTSLLGEKFVSLAPPDTGASDDPLDEGDTIPLDRTGRNPEIEEVLGALSLLLNGGGVAQLKTISSELNLALEGREDSAKSVLRQVESLVSQLDDNKSDIVAAIEALNRLAISAREHQGSIDNALEELPSALDSIDRQREDLVKMLQGLNRLSTVGVRVIRQTKASTIDILEQLQPLLGNLNKTGQDFVDALHIFSTFPFSDDIIGRDPAVARNLHFGDYVNLSVELDLDLNNIAQIACVPFSLLPDGTPLDQLIDLPGLCAGVVNALQSCVRVPPNLQNCLKLPDYLLDEVCNAVPAVCNLLPRNLVNNLLGGNGQGNASDQGTVIGDLLDGILGNLGLPRAAPDLTPVQRENWDRRFGDYGSDLALFLAAPVVGQEVAQ